MTYNEHTNRLFDSFAADEPAAITDAQWMIFRNDTGAFEIRLPAQPQEIKREINIPDLPNMEPYQIYLYMAADKERMVNYIVRYNDFPTGTYLHDKAFILSSIWQNFEQQGNMVGEPRAVFKDGLAGTAANFIAQGMLMEVQVYLRGNRTYLLMRQNMKGTEPIREDAFFDSFHLLEHKPYQPVRLSLGGMEVMMPEQPILIRADESDNESFLKDDKTYAARDKNSGALYSIEYAQISKYFRLDDTDSLFHSLCDALKSGTDSLYNVNRTLASTEFLLVDSVSGIGKRIRMWIVNNHFYMLSAIMEHEKITGAQAQSFFEPAKCPDQTMGFDLKASKAALILEDLRSQDILVFQDARHALAHYTFEKDELPLIHEALKHPYGDDMASSGTKTLLIKKLGQLHDENTVSFMKKAYKQANGTDEVQAAILSEITKIDRGTYDWYLQSLSEQAPLKTDNYYGLFRPLSDSLDYAAGHIDKIFALLHFKEYRTSVLGILFSMLVQEDKPEYLGIVQTGNKDIGAHAMDDLEEYIEALQHGENKGYFTVYQYLQLLPKLALPKLTDEFTDKVLKTDSISYLRTDALAARILAHLPIDEEILKALLVSLDSRYLLMEAFYEVGEMERVPAQYRKQDEFAKLLLYDFLYDDYGIPNAILLLGSIIEEEGRYYAFEFSCMEDGTEVWYMGLCGPFDDQSEKLDFETYRCYTEYEKKENEWEAQARLLISRSAS